MRLLAASVNKEELIVARDFGAYGIITNPTIISYEKKPWKQIVEESAQLLDGPYHLQITESEEDKIRRQVKEFYSILGDRLIIKACITRQVLSMIGEWHDQGLKVNLTGIVSIPQAFVAMQASADFLSVYLGRADKIGSSGVDVVAKANRLKEMKKYTCEIIAASMKGPMHFIDAALAGADWVACPIDLMNLLIEHPVTKASIDVFDEDWNSMPKSE